MNYSGLKQTPSHIANPLIKIPQKSHTMLPDYKIYKQKALPSKKLKWAIEETKQNFSPSLQNHFDLSVRLNHIQNTKKCHTMAFNCENSTNYRTKQIDLNPSKSYKTITFSTDLEDQYQQYSKNFKRMMSSKRIDHFEAEKDDSIINHCPSFFRQSKQDKKTRMIDDSYMEHNKTLNYSKSDKKFERSMVEQRRPEFNKSQLGAPYSAKSSKKISDTVEQKYKKVKDENGFAKSWKYIRDEATCNEGKNIETIKAEEKKPKDGCAPYKDPNLWSTSEINQNQVCLKQKVKKGCFELNKRLSIEDFELGTCKGEGAFGQVYLAVHKHTRMLVALKKVSKEKVRYMQQQFLNEIKIQMYLDSPYIVKLYGFFDDSAHIYIIMEYMEGGSLFLQIKKNKKLSEAQAADRLKEICLGLKEMHDNSILHRDIKPENIVITNDVCKLCDFGWSAICQDRRTTYCGTLDYVSPEIIEGEGYDDGVDIWCIGVLTFEMICGKTPFYNISRKQTMKKIRDVNYEYPFEVSKTAKSFIDRILKKNQNERVGIDELLKDPFLG